MTTVSGGERTGTVLADRYRIDSVIGSGGMSTVYRASDTFLGRTVALKVFRTELADADDLRRQRDEFQLLASLNHPTLVTLFDAVDDTDGSMFLVLEHVDGPDLRGVLSQGALSARMSARIGADIADALAYVHARGIVHRDLKPANILVPSHPDVHDATVEGTVPLAKLADFGIARLIDGSRLTATGSVLGTAGYLSPEQAIGNTVGPASDIYSLGLVLLECLTGVRSFPGSALESAAARLSRDPDVPDTLSAAWRDLVERMTRREPLDRPTARELGADLRALYAAEEDDALDKTALYPEADATAVLDPASATAPQAPAGNASEAETVRLDAALTGRPAAPAPRASEPRSTAPRQKATRQKAPRSPAQRSPAQQTPAQQSPAQRRRIIIAIVSALAIAGIVVAIFTISGQADQARSTTVDYPAVDGDLGEHLEQLQRSVTP